MADIDAGTAEAAARELTAAVSKLGSAIKTFTRWAVLMETDPVAARRRQAQMRPHGAGAAEAVRPVDRGAEGERGDRADARNAHQPPAGLVMPGDIESRLDCPAPDNCEGLKILGSLASA